MCAAVTSRASKRLRPNRKQELRSPCDAHRQKLAPEPPGAYPLTFARLVQPVLEAKMRELPRRAASGTGRCAVTASVPLVGQRPMPV